MDFEVVVIGAGVVGLACAERLSRQQRSVLVVEAERAFGQGTSSRSSQVIHAGLYYPTGSRKARFCVAGNRSIYAWCEAHAVAARRCGKLIVATTESDEAVLDGLRTRAQENGVTDLKMLSGAEVRACEPAVRARCALSSPSSGIVDSHGLMASLLAAACQNGSALACRHRVVAAAPCPAGYQLEVIDAAGVRTQLTARAVVNAAGLSADEVAALPGIDLDAAGYRQRFVKGSYFRLHRRWTKLLSRLVYPVPAPQLTGLGVHATIELDGAIRLGPDVEPLSGRTLDYAVDAAGAARFFAAASTYLDGLRLDDLQPDQAGIRPRLASNSGAGGTPDFIVAEESARGLPRWVNLLGIESPGLTCALELGAHVAQLIPG